MLKAHRRQHSFALENNLVLSYYCHCKNFLSQTQVLCHLFLKVMMSIKAKDSIYAAWKGQAGKTWLFAKFKEACPDSGTPNAG